MKYKFFYLIVLVLIPLSGCFRRGNRVSEDFDIPKSPVSIETDDFDGQKAIKYISQQLEYGDRTPGSRGHALTVEWIFDKLRESGWKSELQVGEWSGFPLANIIAKYGSGDPWIILGAHYDTRIYADKDPNPQKRNLPVPGANDGASGVAVLLELARVLPGTFNGEIWMIFFDAEDNGGISGREWIMGSRYFVSNLEHKPDMMVLVDMVADRDLNIYMERNSNEILMNEIWDVANILGYSKYFIPTKRYAIIDDHIPFIETGIPSVNIIDFDYPYHHTTEDTSDKVSAESLQVVGATLLEWIRNDYQADE